MRISGKASSLALLGGLALLVPQLGMAQTPFEQLVAQAKSEMEAKGGGLRIALDWTDTDAAGVMEQFKADFPFVTEITYERETGIDQFGRYLLEINQGDYPPYDFMHVASEYEQQFVDAGAFTKPPFDYNELNDTLPADWPKLHPAALDPNGMFVSTTGNSRGNIWNPALVPEGEEPTTWAVCTDPKWKGQVLIDARNKLQAFQYDPQERPRMIQWLNDLVANDVVLIRGQAGIVQKVASGEFPIGCGINYHTALRAIEVEGVTTIRFTFAESIPEELATRLFIPVWTKTPATAQLFALWAATAGQDSIGRSAYRGFTWNERAHKYAAAQGKYVSLCGAECALRWDELNAEYESILQIPVAGN